MPGVRIVVGLGAQPVCAARGRGGRGWPPGGDRFVGAPPVLPEPGLSQVYVRRAGRGAHGALPAPDPGVAAGARHGRGGAGRQGWCPVAGRAAPGGQLGHAAANSDGPAAAAGACAAGAGGGRLRAAPRAPLRHDPDRRGHPRPRRGAYRPHRRNAGRLAARSPGGRDRLPGRLGLLRPGHHRRPARRGPGRRPLAPVAGSGRRGRKDRRCPRRVLARRPDRGRRTRPAHPGPARRRARTTRRGRRAVRDGSPSRTWR